MDAVVRCFQVLKESVTELKKRPESGCYIYGLFVEGARWDEDKFELGESKPKELYTNMPVMWLIPAANRKQPDTGVYICPVYKTLTRAGDTSYHTSCTCCMSSATLNTTSVQYMGPLKDTSKRIIYVFLLQVWPDAIT